MDKKPDQYYLNGVPYDASGGFTLGSFAESEPETSVAFAKQHDPETRLKIVEYIGRVKWENVTKEKLEELGGPLTRLVVRGLKIVG